MEERRKDLIMKRRMTISGFLAILAVVTLLVASTFARSPAMSAKASTPARAADDLATMSRVPAKWVKPSLNYANTRFSPLNQINTGNVKNLKAAWTFSLGTLRGQEGQPLVVGHMMYVLSNFPNYLYAIDLRNIGRIQWRWGLPPQSIAAPKKLPAPQARPVAPWDGGTRRPAHPPRPPPQILRFNPGGPHAAL